MPNLDRYFESDHWNADRFQSDHPDGVQWTVKAVSFEQMREGRTKRTVQKPVLWFAESPKFIVISSPIYEAIRARLGPETERWTGAVLTIKAIDGEGFGGRGYGIRVTDVKPPAGASRPRCFGPKIANKLAATLHELDSNVDELRTWLRIHHPELYVNAGDKELEEWLDPVLPACQRYCAELRKERAAAAQDQASPDTTEEHKPASKAEELARRHSPLRHVPITADDIPF